MDLRRGTIATGRSGGLLRIRIEQPAMTTGYGLPPGPCLNNPDKDSRYTMDKLENADSTL